MNLTLEDHPFEKDTLVIVYEGVTWREVVKYLFFKELKSIVRGSSFEEFKRCFFELEEKVAKRQALAHLGRRGYLSVQLAAKLEEKKLSRGSIEKAIAYCKEKGLLNDGELLERLIAVERRKGVGKNLIYQKLKHKGVDPTELKEALKSCGEEEGDALCLAVEKNRKLLEKGDPKGREKLIRKLLYRGFSLEQILKEMNKLRC